MLSKFELKEDHIKLLKHLKWSVKDEIINYMGREELAPFIHNKGGEDDDETDVIPFGGNTLYEGIDLILNGKPVDFLPVLHEELESYSSEQKAIWLKLYKELPTALEIVLLNQTFQTGWYQSTYPLRNWKWAKKQS